MTKVNPLEAVLLLHLCLFVYHLNVCSGFAFTLTSSIPSCRSRSMMRSRPTLSASILLPDQAEERSKSSLFTDFWGHTVRSKDTKSDQGDFLPLDPSLDAHGELPRGAYTLHGNPASSPTEICRIALALDSETTKPDDEFDIPTIVRSLQNYLDDGFQTFQVKSGPGQQHTVVEQEILGRFFDETPAFARERCSVIIPLRIPAITTAGMSPTFVRRHITSSLQRTGLEAIDCIQIQHRKRSPYLLHILDALEDLKREGLVGTVSARNLPPTQLREAQLNGFEIHTNQLDLNLLNPTMYDTEHKLMCSDLGTSMIAASPLAGGLLSDRYRQHMFEPLSSELSRSGNRYLKTHMRDWNARFSDASKIRPWQRFHGTLLSALGSIALKHRVSISTVCLRWALQLNHVSSTSISQSLLNTNTNSDEQLKTSKLIKAYRNVFRFELDEEDMALMWELAGVEESPDEYAFSYDDEVDEEEATKKFEQRNGLYLP